MTISEWQAIIGLIVGVSAVVGILFTVLRFYIRAFAKQELDDIRHELKPNSGTSIKDQVTRLEGGHDIMRQETKQLDAKLERLEEKVDKMFDIILKHFGQH